MAKVQVQVGDRFGRLVIAELVRIPDGRWTKGGAIVDCDCGTRKRVLVYNLKSGNTTSCGCHHREVVRRGRATTVTRNGKTFTRDRNHGQSRTPLYRQWKAMIRRCESPSAHNYKWYGGKGIKVCAEWRQDFLAFKDWAEANGYIHGLELDRKNSNGDYCPENCQYVTKAQNLRNMRVITSDSLEAEIRAASKALRITTGALLDRAARHYLDHLRETGALGNR